MSLPALSVRRPVAATVVSLVIVLFGLFVLPRLALRELPDVESPEITVTTIYPGAAPEVIDTDVTEPIESAIAGVAGIDTITSQSRLGQARTTIEFLTTVDISEAANDVRDAVNAIVNDLPEDAELPVVSKNNSDSDPIIRLSVFSDSLTPTELTDLVERKVVDRLATLDGVAQIEIDGERRQAMRIWLDRQEMAAREVTAQDVEDALRRNNVELPAGQLRSGAREFSVRADARLAEVDQFKDIMVKAGDRHATRLAEVAHVALGVEDDQTGVRTNGRTAIGMNVLRQSKANTVAISDLVRKEIEILSPSLPPGTEIVVAFDEAKFVQASIKEVGRTLGFTVLIVIAVIFLFLGSWRSVLIPGVTIPVALIGTLFGIYLLGFSINTLTLLALVLAVGILVDDAIVILENIQRHMSRGAEAVQASIAGTNQVFFAVLATSMTLVAVFLPISLMEGKVGRLFTEFGVVMALVVLVSTTVALTLCPMLASKLFAANPRPSKLSLWMDHRFAAIERAYGAALHRLIKLPWLVCLGALAVAAGTVGIYDRLPSELTTQEDRGVFFVSLTGPQGANYDYINAQSAQVEDILQPLLDNGEAEVVRSIMGFRGAPHRAFIVVSLKDWDDRERTSAQIAAELIPPLSEVTGARAFPVLPTGLGLRGSRQPLQIVIGGHDHQEVKQWVDQLAVELEKNPNLLNIEIDYEENQPEFGVNVDRLRADDLGISVEEIGRTLQTMIASRDVTRFIDRGREYDVILQAGDDDRRVPHDLTSIFVRSDTSGQLIPLDSVVSVSEQAAAATLRRHDRLPSITISAALADGYDLGSAITFASQAVEQTLPAEARLAFNGLSKEYVESSGTIMLTIALAVIVVYLVLAAQFESFLQPLAIMLTVPMATTGALLALWLTGNSLNIFSQVGLILLVGLMAKNGILIVEFANQLLREGQSVAEAAVEGAVSRLRPIVMTLLSTIFGAIPLVLASGAGAESRLAIGTIVMGGLISALCLTLFVIPVLYNLLTRQRRIAPQALDEIQPKAQEAPL